MKVAAHGAVHALVCHVQAKPGSAHPDEQFTEAGTALQSL